MIKKLLLASLFLFSIAYVTGQSFSTIKQQNSRFISLNMNPSVIVIVDSVNYDVDSATADEIKNEWIEKVIVMKDDTTKKLYGNKNGVVFIYTKRKYKKEILKEIEKQ